MNPNAFDLTQRSCMACENGSGPMADAEAARHLESVPDWQRHENGIIRTFTFKNYYQTVSFINAVAWIAHREDHHPDISFGYKTCTVRYCTHSIRGLSLNDFICAAKIDALLSKGN